MRNVTETDRTYLDAVHDKIERNMVGWEDEFIVIDDYWYPKTWFEGDSPLYGFEQNADGEWRVAKWRSV